MSFLRSNFIWTGALPGIFVVSVLAMGMPAARAEKAGPVLNENFESAKWGSLAKRLTEHPHLWLVPGEGVNGSKALRARYAGGPMGSERIIVWTSLPEAGDEYSLNYDVKFEKGFQFVKGGKLHGFGPRKPVSGGRRGTPEGWSARVMFRKEGAAETYVYHQDQKGRYGEHGTISEPGFRFEPERYYAVTLHVKLNDPAQAANGFARLYVDGRLIDAREDVRFRAVDGEDTLISRLMFSTFHGGNSSDWAPKNKSGDYTAVYALFDNLAVYPGRHVRDEPGQ